MNFKELALSIQDKLVEYRRDFHSEPELSFCEVKTNAKIVDFLKENDIEIQPIDSGYSVVGIIRGAKEGKTFGIRADIDALPMPELNDKPYKSKFEGVMHACGHDAHTATLMGTALILNSVKDKLCGNVKLFFQAAEEENPGGAIGMIKAGCLENPKVDAVTAFHVNTGLECGKIAYGPGAMQASPDAFKIKVTGVGGHAAYPHKTIDPVVISANLIVAIQNIVSRSIDPLQSAVITVGSIHGGSKENIIADEVLMQGTIRSLDKDIRELLHKRLEEVCKGVAITFNCKIDLEILRGYPVLINDNKFLENHIAPSVEKIVGKENLSLDKAPTMGGEDFAYFLEYCEGAMGSLGAGNKEKGITIGGHNSLYDIDEDCLSVGAAALAQIAFDYLNG